MGSMALVEVSPPKLVEVLSGGVWHDGILEAWRRTDGRWGGYVRWNVGVGMRYLSWVDQDQLRPLERVGKATDQRHGRASVAALSAARADACAVGWCQH
jgi:hypothetical protein